jgi:hypothetical protein
MSVNLIFLPTRFAFKLVFWKRPKRRTPLFTKNPATGALEVAPEHRDEVCRALTRAARGMSRRIIFRSRIRQLLSYPRIVGFRCILAAMRLFNKSDRVFPQRIID